MASRQQGLDVFFDRVYLLVVFGELVQLDAVKADTLFAYRELEQVRPRIAREDGAGHP
ncbi:MULTISPECIES: hypothetical protein [Achromobacter]|uniref:Uncharacterized protein n=1 Tax=Achromobacter spanius TaxID=217203 RepID=A0ABY8GV86_9BURK|nr:MULTISPECIES: hypothetical protein [Achromobacter]WAI82299.1 hypothetical protein N8Z00_22625 [Achromobacter spanius]WEX92387.1 hypothetical protein N3Z32_17230 [Achromobacter sp. SS2-2022]WFP08463.1 hypothetical protein P8T11_00900 [Achromobacter spanius]